MRLKSLCVRYKLSNLKESDVSRAEYTEGMLGKMGLWGTLATKVVTNTVGVTLAGTGYALGKASTAMSNILPEHLSGGRCEVADSWFFQAGFKSWLFANGIAPSVVYHQKGVNDKIKEDIRLTPILVANHVCYLDGMVLAGIFGAPKVIAMAGTLQTPVLGTFASEIGVIEVDRRSKDSRSATMEAITKHADSWTEGRRPLLLFPEGTTSNGDSMLDFKRGAFVPGKPVRPMVIVYTGSWHPANVNFKVSKGGGLEATNDAEWYKEFMGHLIHSLQVEVLPPYIPSEEEVNDPDLYAENVRGVMLKTHARMCARNARAAEAKKNGGLLQGMDRLLGSVKEDCHETPAASAERRRRRLHELHQPHAFGVHPASSAASSSAASVPDPIATAAAGVEPSCSGSSLQQAYCAEDANTGGSSSSKYERSRVQEASSKAPVAEASVAEHEDERVWKQRQEGSCASSVSSTPCPEPAPDVAQNPQRRTHNAEGAVGRPGDQTSDP